MKTSIKGLLLVVDPNQFLQTNFIRMVWHGTVRRINYEILGVKGTYWALLVSADSCGTSQLYCTRSQEVLWQSFFTPEGLVVVVVRVPLPNPQTHDFHPLM